MRRLGAQDTVLYHAPSTDDAAVIFQLPGRDFIFRARFAAKTSCYARNGCTVVRSCEATLVRSRSRISNVLRRTGKLMGHLAS